MFTTLPLFLTLGPSPQLEVSCHQNSKSVACPPPHLGTNGVEIGQVSREFRDVLCRAVSQNSTTLPLTLTLIYNCFTCTLYLTFHVNKCQWGTWHECNSKLSVSIMADLFAPVLGVARTGGPSYTDSVLSVMQYMALFTWDSFFANTIPRECL